MNNKYGVRQDAQGKRDRTLDGILFDSKREKNRYAELKLLERGNVITDLRLQVPYVCMVNDKKICTYKADFVYVESGEEIVEDTKGFATATYRLKKKLVEALFCVKITET